VQHSLHAPENRPRPGERHLAVPFPLDARERRPYHPTEGQTDVGVHHHCGLVMFTTGRLPVPITNPQVIHETIDGETIIIDLASGTYYSLQGSGPDIWNALAEGETEAGIAARLTRIYRGKPEDIEAAVTDFMRELETEGLVRRNGTVASGPAAAADGEGGAGGDAVFAPPTLEKFTDMQDIILLDPVHEVGERGWPHTDPAKA
jgi:coenzyme PQQ synthesis protein D (PqqD)